MKYPLSIFVILLSGLILLLIPNSYGLTSLVPDVDYNDQKLRQQNHMWQLGKNLSIGDSYTYKICDPKTMQTSAANYHYFTQGNKDHNDSVCYTIKMDFVNLLSSDENQIGSDVWVVQAAIHENSTLNNNDDLRYSVFHIDTKTFEVKSSDHNAKKYADSLQKTLFSLFKYTASEPQLLQIGVGWGEVTEALGERGKNPHMAVLDNNQEFSVTTQHQFILLKNQNEFVTRDITDAFKVGYEIDIFDLFVLSSDKKKIIEEQEEDTNNIISSFLIITDLPFPLSAESFNPVYVTQPQKQYEFELITFFTNIKNIDFEIKPVVDVITNDNVEDLPIVERGTIALTFPDDDVVEVVVEVVVDDDVVEVVVEVVVDDDVVEVVTDNNDIKVDDNNTDYSNMLGLAVLLILMIGGFVIFKKFKALGFKNEFGKTLKKNKHNSASKAVIPFDENLHIDIRIKRNR